MAQSHRYDTTAVHAEMVARHGAEAPNPKRVQRWLREPPPDYTGAWDGTPAKLQQWLGACRALECHRLATLHGRNLADIVRRHGAKTSTASVRTALAKAERHWAERERATRPEWVEGPIRWPERATAPRPRGRPNGGRAVTRDWTETELHELCRDDVARVDISDGYGQGDDDLRELDSRAELEREATADYG